jgi:fatty acid desaturase
LAVTFQLPNFLNLLRVYFPPYAGADTSLLDDVGLKDNVSDFRLCCRTFTLNPVVRFLYWQMNYHIEHHMYAAVPCYNLGKLHKMIGHDLPPTPKGLAGVWREINAILKKQEADPTYQHEAPLPASTRLPSVPA